MIQLVLCSVLAGFPGSSFPLDPAGAASAWFEAREGDGQGEAPAEEDAPEGDPDPGGEIDGETPTDSEWGGPPDGAAATPLARYTSTRSMSSTSQGFAR
jgi:hypothetical protein